MNTRGPSIPTTLNNSDLLKTGFLIFAAALLYIGTLILFGPNLDSPYTNGRANSDFFSYYMLAYHWSEGDPSLAISGYWGPLFSWLMAPFIDLEISSTRLGWYTVFATGGLFLAACVPFIQTCLASYKYQLAAALSIALYTAYNAGQILTADLLLNALILAGNWALINAYRERSRAFAVVAGVFFGAAYLAKTPGVVFGLGFILGYSALLLLSDEKKWQTVARMSGTTLIAMMVVVIPWVLTLSLHYGEFTWTTAAGRSTEIAAGGAHPNFAVFHVPREGRVHSWEDPTELEGRTTAPQLSAADLIRNVAENYRIVSSILINPQWFALVAAGLVAFFLHPGDKPRYLDAPWRLGLLGSAVIIAPYLATYPGSERYFISCYPMLLVAALGCIHWSEKSGLLNWRTVIGRSSHNFTPLLLALVLVVLWLPLTDRLRWGNLVSYDDYTVAKTIAEKLRYHNLVGSVAEIGSSHLAYHTAIHLKSSFHGQERSLDNLERLLEQNTDLLIVSDKRVAEELSLPQSSDVTGLLLEWYPELPSRNIRIYRLDVGQAAVDH